MKEIGEYFNYQDDGVETYTKHSIDLVNKDGKIKNSNKGVYSGYKPTKKISTEQGYEIEGTYVHPILVMTEQGELKWKQLKDIKVGDFIAVNRNNNVWGSKTKLNITEDSIREELLLTREKEGIVSNTEPYVKLCKIPTDLDEDLALLMGYLTGDGCMTRDNRASLTNIDQEIKDNFSRISFDKFGLIPSETKDEIDQHLGGKFIRELFNQLGMKQVDSHGKEIPKAIMEAPKSIVASFLTGLFDTDGTVENSRINLNTSSEKLSRQVQIALLNFGIVSSRRKKYNKKYDSYSYNVNIYGKNIELFHEEIGFKCSRKQVILESSINTKRNTNKDIVPLQKIFVSEFFNEAKHYNSYLYDKIYHVLKGNNELTYEKLDMLLGLNNSSNCARYSDLKNLQDLNYFYSKVESVEDSEAHVYDLQVPDTNSFIANGIVNHNTFLELLNCFHACIFYPDIEIAMTAQTMENASSLVQSKWREVLKFYPIIEKELLVNPPRLSRDKSTVEFKSGGVLDTLQNGQSSKGQRRKRIMVEEFAQVNNAVFLDAIEPIPNQPRITLGRHRTTSPYELNGQIIYITTSWYVGTDSYDKCVNMSKDMLDPKKGSIILGADWELAVNYGRGESENKILQKKASIPATTFALNYESRWVGVATGALVSMKLMAEIRTLTKPELKGRPNREYYLGVDVARSDDSEANNQCFISVVKVIRGQKGKVDKMQLVNLINIPSTSNFRIQAEQIMKIQKLYNARMVIVDGNGLGTGLIDALSNEQFDDETGESLGCWKTVNTERDSEIDNASEILFDFKATGKNDEVITDFTSIIGDKKLELLERKSDINYEEVDFDYVVNESLPFIQTEYLMDELANLKLEFTQKNKPTVKQQVKRIGKDRYASLAYVLWYIKNYEDGEVANSNNEIKSSDYLFIN